MYASMLGISLIVAAINAGLRAGVSFAFDGFVMRARSTHWAPLEQR